MIAWRLKLHLLNLAPVLLQEIVQTKSDKRMLLNCFENPSLTNNLWVIPTTDVFHFSAVSMATTS